MTILHLLLAAACVTGATCDPSCAKASRTSYEAAGTHQEPLACRLDALTPEERKEHARLIDEVMGSVTEKKELPNGYAFHLRPGAEAWAQAVQLAGFERRCCPFFDIKLEWKSGDAAAWLALSGRKGVKNFLRETMPAALAKR